MMVMARDKEVGGSASLIWVWVFGRRCIVVYSSGSRYITNNNIIILHSGRSLFHCTSSIGVILSWFPYSASVKACCIALLDSIREISCSSPIDSANTAASSSCRIHMSFRSLLVTLTFRGPIIKWTGYILQWNYYQSTQIYMSMGKQLLIYLFKNFSIFFFGSKYRGWRRRTAKLLRWSL